MVKSKRQAIYDWIAKNKENYGAIYSNDWIMLKGLDYDRIRIRIKQGYPFAEYEMKRVSDTKVQMLIRIKEKPQNE